MTNQEFSYQAPSAEEPLVSPNENSSGLIAMILGIVSLLVGGAILGIPAIFLGRKGRRLADAGRATNRGQATAGLVTGSIATAVSCLVILVAVIRSAG